MCPGPTTGIATVNSPITVMLRRYDCLLALPSRHEAEHVAGAERGGGNCVQAVEALVAIDNAKQPSIPAPPDAAQLSTMTSAFMISQPSPVLKPVAAKPFIAKPAVALRPQVSPPSASHALEAAREEIDKLKLELHAERQQRAELEARLHTDVTAQSEQLKTALAALHDARRQLSMREADGPKWRLEHSRVSGQLDALAAFVEQQAATLREQETELSNIRAVLAEERRFSVNGGGVTGSASRDP